MKTLIDLLIRVKNAQQAGQKTVEAQLTKVNKAVAEILQEAGFLTKFEVKGRSPKQVLEMRLNSQQPIRGLKFLSRPSIRRYSNYKDLYKVKGGRGFLVISTSKGVMTAKAAKKAKVGGQLLFEIW